MVLGVVAVVWFYYTWQFAFHYQEELLKPVSSRQAAYQHLFLADHGHVGVVVTGALGVVCSLMAINAMWRAWAVLPAAILGPEQLWLHPSFGKKPIPYSDIVGVRLAYIWNRKDVALIVDLEGPAKRNWVVWAWASSRCQAVARSIILDESLFSMARFRDRLARNAEVARSTLHASVTP